MTGESYVGARYDQAARRGHVESYFLKANDPSSRRALWLRTTIFASDRAPDRAIAEAWAIAFSTAEGHVAVKTSVPFADAHFDRSRLDVEVAGVALRAFSVSSDGSGAAGEARGRIESGARSIELALTFESRDAPLVHFPHPWMYEGPVPSSKIVSPLPDLRVSGEAVIQGERWTLDRWPGMLGHNWGHRNAHLYAWGQCNTWDGGEDVVFEGFSARAHVGPSRLGVLTPMTTLLCVRHRGVRYDLNAMSALLENSGRVTPRRWRFRGANDLVSVKGELWGTTDDFVGLHYPNPDGTMTYCLNSKIATAEIAIRERGRAPMTLRSRAAALEVGTSDPAHGTRMYL
jgi:Tocopherol cyclase